MTLSDRDAKLFYELWLPLLDYVNETCKVNRKVKNLETGENLNPQEVKEIANVLWDDVSLIDRYLMGAGKGISDANKEIIRSWKRRIQGRFVMERHLKKELFLWQKIVRYIKSKELYLAGKKCFGEHQCRC